MMRKIIIFVICFNLVLNLFSEQIKGFDNLQVSFNPITNATYDIKETEPGIYTIEFKEKDNIYNLLLTLYPVENKFKIEDVKRYLEDSGKKLLSRAEEKTIKIINILDNSTISGYYFMLTDKLARKDDFKYMLQGYIKYHYSVGYFTFLFNDKNNIDIFNQINIQKLITETPALDKTTNFESIKLNEDEIKNYQMQYIKHYYSQVQVNFYNGTDAYKTLLSDVIEKYTQSICNNDEVGTIFYYYFKDKIDSGKFSFLNGLFYGDSGKPSKDYPEKFIYKDNYLIIFSYPYNSKLAEELILKIKAKLK